MRFSRHSTEEFLPLLDYYETELSANPRLSHLLHPYVRCIRSDDSSLLSAMKEKYYKDPPSLYTDDIQHILQSFAKDYEYLLTTDVRLSRKKKNAFCVYLRVYPATGHFYIGHSSMNAAARNKSEFYFVRGDISKWTRTGNISIIHEFIRDLIIRGGDDSDFLTTNLISFEDKESAEIYEELLIVLVSLSKIPGVNPEKMLNTQYRINERYFVYENYRGQRLCYVNDFPTFYRFSV